MAKRPSPQWDEKKRQQWLAFVQELSPGTDPQTIRLVGLLHRVAHALYQISEGSLVEAGLSYAQYRLLMNLLFCERFEGCGALNPSEISERQGIGRNTVSALIRQLEEDRLVERRLDEEDRRKFNITLTDAGRKVVQEYASRHFHTVHDHFNELDPAEQQAMGQLLDKLAQSLAVQQGA